MNEFTADPFETIRDRKKHAFLTAYAAFGGMRAAIRAVGISRSSPYYWKRHDPEFAEAFELAKQIAIDRLQGEMFRRAWGEKRFKHLEDGQPIVDPETGEPYFELVYDTQALIHVLGRLL